MASSQVSEEAEGRSQGKKPPAERAVKIVEGAIGAQAGNPVRQNRPARLASIASTLEAQHGWQASNGTVAHADRAHPVLVDSPAAFTARDASVVFLGFDEHHIRLLIDTSDLHSAKAKQINIIQPPTPNAETHSSRAKRESNLHTTRAAI